MHGSGVARLMNPRAWGHLFGEVEGAEGEQKQETRVSPKDSACSRNSISWVNVLTDLRLRLAPRKDDEQWSA